jgi:hypothetical protein
MEQVFNANGSKNKMKILVKCDNVALVANEFFFSFAKPVTGGWVIERLQSFIHLDSEYQAKVAVTKAGWPGSEKDIENAAYSLWEEKNKLDCESQ